MIFLIISLTIISVLGLLIHIYVDKYSPLIYPLIFWFIYELPKMEYYFFHEITLYDIKYYIFIIIGAILYFSGILFNILLIKKRNKQNLILFKNFNTFKRISSFLFLVTLIWFAYIFITKADFNLLYFFARRLGDDEIQQLVSSSYLFVVLFNVSILFQTIILTESFSKTRLLKFMVSLSLIFLFTGSRGYVLLPTLFILITLFIRGRRIFYIIPVLIITILSFSILGSLRSFNDQDNFSLESLIDKSDSFSINEYQLQNRDVAALKYYENRPLMYGSSYMAVFTSFIPRSVLGNIKPEMLDGKIGRDVFGNYYAGFPVHPVTEALLNFGYAGILVLFILGFLFTQIIKSCSDLLSYSIFSYLLLFSQTGYTTYLLYSFQFFILIMLISFLSRTNFLIK
tara:strand:+ start:7210 stop:8406 length:1197 start_codon:yes stop_codon:yes gene_type:complete